MTQLESASYTSMQTTLPLIFLSDAQETYDWLKSICGNVHMVNGDCDDGRSHPDDAVLTIGDLKVGLIHGHQV